MLVWALDSIRRIVLPKTSAEILELVQLTRAKQTLKAGVGAGTGLAGMALMMPAAVQAAREGAVGFAQDWAGSCLALRFSFPAASWRFIRIRGARLDRCMTNVSAHLTRNIYV